MSYMIWILDSLHYNTPSSIVACHLTERDNAMQSGWLCEIVNSMIRIYQQDFLIKGLVMYSRGDGII